MISASSPFPSATGIKEGQLNFSAEPSHLSFPAAKSDSKAMTIETLTKVSADPDAQPVRHAEAALYMSMVRN